MVVEESVIKKLDDETIRYIAAGEVVQSSWNAVKELIENSLDAGAKRIQITIKEGGYNLIQVQDDGKGIKKEDLSLACARFCTSKIRQKQDLNDLSSYGFRGEALAALSVAGHVEIRSKPADQAVGYKYEKGHKVYGRASYAEQKLVTLEPCACLEGTTISIKELFFRYPLRRSKTQEVNGRIYELIQRYHVEYNRIKFVLKIEGKTHTFLPGEDRGVVLEEIAKGKLTAFSIATSGFSVEGHASSVWYRNSRSSTIFITVKNRPIEFPRLKKAIESLYSLYLLKGNHPFVYLHLSLPGSMIDVNVHPAKLTVVLYCEEEVLASVTQELEKLLCHADSVNFETKVQVNTLKENKVDEVFVNTVTEASKVITPVNEGIAKGIAKGIAPVNQVLSPANEITPPVNQVLSPTNEITPPVNQVLSPANEITPSITEITLSTITEITLPTATEIIPSTVSPSVKKVTSPASPVPSSPYSLHLLSNSSLTDNEPSSQKSIPPYRINRVEPSTRKIDSFFSSQIGKMSKKIKREFIPVQYTSILELRQETKDRTDPVLFDLLQNHVFVGFLDDKYALVQCRTELFMIPYSLLCTQLFEQLTLIYFSNFGVLELTSPVSVLSLLSQHISTNHLSDSPKTLCDILLEKAEMLHEYFQMEFQPSSKTLSSLPLVIRGHTPNPAFLPLFLYTLAKQTDWSEEKPCFQNIAHRLALFYSSSLSPDVLEHCIFPAFQSSFFYPQANTHYAKLTDLHSLYKVFERC